ncbi:MAG: TlyA family rRNA (cytidine-2'-O)-methyltransferase [Hyphobacterium sp.]|nr:MAG: TlyA family rRNA (cytidine-2'-O)-methyltransferase [Hyphobacterium sp.]
MARRNSGAVTRTRLDVYLVESGAFESRARARAAIEAGLVSVDSRIITKASFQLPDGAHVSAQPLHSYVSRAALKLRGALDHFPVDVGGKNCLDVGASTGGFVEVLLEAGAAHVAAVDVGRDQLHEKLRGDRRVQSLEKTDARYLSIEGIGFRPAIITCDASFIGLAKVIETPLTLAAGQCDLVALFKPQFEVGQKNVGKGGLVKDNAASLAALDQFRIWICGRSGFEVQTVIDSPVTGGDGNREFLVHARKG